MMFAVAGPYRAADVDAFGILIYVIVITIWLASAINGVIKRARRAGDKAETNTRSRAEDLRRRAQMTQAQPATGQPATRLGVTVKIPTAQAGRREYLEQTLAPALADLVARRLQQQARADASGPATEPSSGATSMTIPPQAATLPPTQHPVHFHADEPQVYVGQALDREAAARRSDAMVAFAQHQIDQVAATTAIRPEHGAAIYVDSSHVAGWVTRAIVGAAVIGPPVALRGGEQLPVGW